MYELNYYIGSENLPFSFSETKKLFDKRPTSSQIEEAVMGSKALLDCVGKPHDRLKVTYFIMRVEPDFVGKGSFYVGKNSEKPFYLEDS